MEISFGSKTIKLSEMTAAMVLVGIALIFFLDGVLYKSLLEAVTH
jgi:hypothetical protein